MAILPHEQHQTRGGRLAVADRHLLARRRARIAEEVGRAVHPALVDARVRARARAADAVVAVRRVLELRILRPPGNILSMPPIDNPGLDVV